MRKIASLLALFLALPAGAATVNVTIGPGLSFTPSTVNVVVGDTVQWSWAAGSIPHSTTSDTNTGEVWNSGIKSTGTFSHTFANVGNWGYYCVVHSTPTGTAMNGVVHVSAAAPTLTNVNPTGGPTAGGTSVTLTGTNFASGCTVSFGGTAAASAVVQTSTTIVATTPAHAAGPANVAVACPGGTATLTNAFTFASAPTIVNVQPLSSPPGLSVTITGTGFQNGATVKFGTTLASSVTFVNSGSLTATVPSIPPGAVGVTVTNPDTQNATFTGFSVLAAAAIPLLDPRVMWILAAALAAIAIGALRARGL